MAIVTTPSALRTMSVGRIRTPPGIISKRARAYIELMPWWRGDVSGTFNGASFLAINRAGVIAGKVTLDEVPVQYAHVFLFYLPTMTLIRTGRTDENGDYSFSGLDKSSNKYVAVARIPPHNAMIFDTLTPA